MTIVVVDDEPAIVKTCESVLGAQGHRVYGFTTTREALAHLAHGAADLLVVDYMMPEQNGFEFIQEAWSLRPALRVVMITAHGHPGRDPWRGAQAVQRHRPHPRRRDGDAGSATRLSDLEGASPFPKPPYPWSGN